MYQICTTCVVTVTVSQRLVDLDLDWPHCCGDPARLSGHPGRDLRVRNKFRRDDKNLEFFKYHHHSPR